MGDEVGTTADTFHGLFLEGGEVPGMERVQDSRDQGADAGDAAFAEHGGLFAGFQVWMAAPSSAMWRLVDIRWVFPTAGAATAYHRATLQQNAEGHAAVAGAPAVGEGCAVFGGTEPIPGVPDVTMTAYYYVFRVLNVVVKLFAAQGPELGAGTLTPADVATVARRIEERIAILAR